MSTKQVAIIGGTGFSDGLIDGTSEIVTNQYGTAEIVRCITPLGHPFVFLARHGAGHAIPPHKINHLANITALAELGVTHVLASAAVGSLRSEFSPGSFVVPHDFIDLSKGGPLTLFDRADGVQHTDFSHPFDPVLRRQMLERLRKHSPNEFQSTCVYVSVSGPRYETPAEISMFARFGGDVIGMTVGPEATLAREIGLKYAIIGVVTNYGAGISDGVLSHDDVLVNMKSAFPRVRDVLTSVCDEISTAVNPSSSR